MVSDKLPLIRLLKACDSREVAEELCRRLSDFRREIGHWVHVKLAALSPRFKESGSGGGDAVTTREEPLLDEAWEDFRNWKSWTDKRAKLNQKMYDNLRHFLGNVPVSSVRKRDIKGALEGISRLPKGNLRAYKGLPLDRLCSLSVPAEDRVSSKYVKEHLKLCQSLFSRYLKQEVDVLRVSPTEGVRWEHENNRYGCLTDAQVRVLVEHSGDKPVWFRWFLLMALYSGARRSELARLTKDDIRRCPDTGRYYFVVKEGKTKAARRAVPIHDRLLQLGFMDWVEAQDDKLFKVAFQNPNRVTDLFGSTLGVKTSDHGDRLVFHSVRHTFITKARAAGNDTVLVQQVVGHEKRGAGQTDRYTHTFQLKDVLSVVDCICYDRV
jgi:site-specific recombinase XerD